MVLKQVQSQSVGIGSSATVNTLNRLYSNPTTAPLVQKQVLKVYQKTPSPLANDRYSTQQVGNRFRSAPIPSLIKAGSGVGSPNIITPDYGMAAARSARIQAQNVRISGVLSGNTGVVSGLGGIAFQQKVIADREAFLQTPEGIREQERIKLTREFSNEYYPLNPSRENLEDFARLKQREAANNQLQQAIDAYQSKPENRRALYDRAVAAGQIQPPEGYRSEILDRLRQQEKDGIPIDDSIPYQRPTGKPVRVFGPNGVTEEELNDNPSNIPATLVPAPGGGPVNLTDPDVDNNFAATVRLRFYSPNNRRFIDGPVRSFRISTIQGYTVILTDDNTTGPEIDLSTLEVFPIDGSSIQPTNRSSSSPPPQPIPTRPGGKADLKPFNPRIADPVKPRQKSPLPTAQPARSPQVKPLGKLGTPQLPQTDLPSLSPLPAGMPVPNPAATPLSRFLDPRVQSTGVGENNPVRARSINGSPTPTATLTASPQPLAVPTPVPLATPAPDKSLNLTPEVATKLQEQIQPIPQPTATKPRQCEDPCTQKLHDKIDEQNKFETIEFNIFKECNKDTGEPVYTSASLPVPRIAAAIMRIALNKFADSQGQQCTLEKEECYAAIPDWWQIRLGADIPQAIVQYAEIKDGNKFGSPMYAVSIPYYCKSKEATNVSDFPVYTKGQRMGILTLRDNSKLIINASEDDVEPTIKKLQNLIAPLQLIDSVYSDGKRKGKALKTIRVAPRIVKFFPTGQLDLKPQWIKYF